MGKDKFKETSCEKEGFGVRGTDEGGSGGEGDSGERR